MSQWRREALERFPELHRQIADAEGAHFVWMALWHSLFIPAYKKNPPDREMATRVYEYATWCLKQQNSPVRMAVVDQFYENLPDNPQTRREMPQWISQEDFDMLLGLLDFAWDDTVRQDFANFRRKLTRNR